MQTHSESKRVGKNVTRAYTKRIICLRMKCKLKRIPFYISTPFGRNWFLFHPHRIGFIALWWNGDGSLQL